MVGYKLLSDEKRPLCNRWEGDDSIHFERAYTVRYLRNLIEKFLGTEGLDKYRHRIPDVVKALYILGKYENAFFY